MGVNLKNGQTVAKFIEGITSKKSLDGAKRLAFDFDRLSPKAKKAMNAVIVPSKTSTMVNTLDGCQYSSTRVIKMLEEHPDLAKRLSEVVGPDGKKLFSEQDIYDILYNCRNTIKKHPHRMDAILSNPEELASISQWRCHGAGLWRACQDPLSSTKKLYPKFWEC